MRKSIYSLVFILPLLFSCSINSTLVGDLRNDFQIRTQKNSADYFKRQARLAFCVIPSSLDSKVPDIVEQTIYNAITVKKYYPAADYTGIANKLNKVALDNPDPSIRVKALLASIYLTTNEAMQIDPDFNRPDHDYIYNQITAQLNNEVLAQNLH